MLPGEFWGSDRLQIGSIGAETPADRLIDIGHSLLITRDSFCTDFITILTNLSQSLNHRETYLSIICLSREIRPSCFTEGETMNAPSSIKKLQRRWLWLPALALLALAALPILGQQGHGNAKRSPTPPGLYITPRALDHAVQQVLNPGLVNYPNFVAGEAVKAVVSPDGKTLAILTAGMNSLYFPNVGEPSTNPNLGQVDQSASTQFLFFYDV